MWSRTVRQRKTKTTGINQGNASEMLAYLVRERNTTSQTRKIRKIRTNRTKEPRHILKNVMQEDLKGCKKHIRAEEEQITYNRCADETTRRRGRRYRHKAGGEWKIWDKKRNAAKRTKQANKITSVVATALAFPPLNSTETKTTTHCTDDRNNKNRVAGTSSTTEHSVSVCHTINSARSFPGMAF